jgi:PPK2 family polyphosphate:nucleotide phosphotransferase
MKSIHKKLERLFRVRPHHPVHLKDFDSAWAEHEQFSLLGRGQLKAKAQAILESNRKDLRSAQELLWANDTHAVLIVLQGMDASGKDGIIRHVMTGVNPQGCEVHSFKKPSDEELDHTFLWRFMTRLPERGRIGIFNRSYYEDVLVTRVHPAILEQQRRTAGGVGRHFWNDRYDDIAAFERHLVRNGTLVLKFFLYMSKEEQRQRLLARTVDPSKQWKFSEGDLEEREYWDAYMRAFEDALTATSTKWAPWWVIPADHKWVARALVASVVTRAIQDLDLRMPVLSPERTRALRQARKSLTSS